MDENGAKPPQEATGIPSMMQKMCCSGEFIPADMCRRMLSSMGRATAAAGQPAPSTGTPAETQRTPAEGDAHGDCCGPQPTCDPKHR